MQEEAKRRDHRRLGQELDLFSIQEDAGGGLVFWHPNGAIIRHVIETYWKDLHLRRGILPLTCLLLLLLLWLSLLLTSDFLLSAICR